jgi:8-oxo-dGTP pyrophosphatase MutT (NUDIX family)
MSKIATSAGGVIVKKDEGNYFVFLLRDSSFPNWQLAKGHMETGETLEQTALRETKEEAGLYHIKILGLLGTYERFVEKSDEQKTIYYFLMTPTKDEVPSGSDLPNFESKWFPLDNLPPMYLPEQLDVITKNLDKIKNLVK